MNQVDYLVQKTIEEMSKLSAIAVSRTPDLRHVCPIAALKMGKNPGLIVFDLDFTLWPFDCDKDVIAPYTRNEQGVMDSRGRWANPYVDVAGIIGTLYHAKIPIAFASRNPSSESIKALLRTIPMATNEGEKTLWDALPSEDYFHAYGTLGANRGKDPHFAALKKVTGLEFSDMLFFDDLPQNIQYARRQGTPSIYLDQRRGLTWVAFLEGIALWRACQKSV
jgi:magnesium-dependent phosphatase 1